MLKKDGINAKFVGSQKSGNMTESRNEGHPGFKIQQMLDVSKNSIKENPELVLVFVGSNNMNNDADALQAPAAMEKTLDGLFKAAPKTAILVSSLTTSKDAAAAKRIEKFAKDLIPIVKKLADAGKHVQLIDMTKLLDVKTDYKDGLHPNDAGFKKIARSFYKGIQEIQKKNWVDSGKKDKTTTKTDKTKSHKESASESEKESHDKSKKVNADGSKVETSKDNESSNSASAESDKSTEKTVTTGPKGTKSSDKAETHDESASVSEKESKEKIEKTNANGSKEISTKTAEEAKAAEEEANSKKQNTNVVNADGSTETSSSSNENSSKSSNENTSSTESTTTISKRSAKFRLLKN